MGTIEQELAEQIVAGKRVLVRIPEYWDRRDTMRRVRELVPEATIFNSTVRHPPTGGLAHFVEREREVYGAEYHSSVGYLTPVMQSRVRLA